MNIVKFANKLLNQMAILQSPKKFNLQQIDEDNIGDLVQRAWALKETGKIKAAKVDLGLGPAKDYGQGKYTGD